MLRPVLLVFIAGMAFVLTAQQQQSVEMAMRLVGVGKLADAETMLRDLARADPGGPDVRYRLGLVLLKEGKLEESREILTTLSKTAPKFPNIFAALALTHEALAKRAAAENNAPEAAKQFQTAIRLDPSRLPYYLELAQLLLDHETPEPAELVLQNAVARFPGNADLLRMLGLAQFAQGKNSAALDAFLSAIDADPDSDTSYASLEPLLPEAGARLPDTVARLRAYSSKHPGSPVGPYLLALAGDKDRAELLRRAIRAAPGFWPAHFELFKQLKSDGNDDEALAELRQTISLHSDFAPAHYALAEYYSRGGDRAAAARERELHHQLLERQRRAEQEHRARAPRLAFTVEHRP